MNTGHKKSGHVKIRAAVIGATCATLLMAGCSKDPAAPDSPEPKPSSKPTASMTPVSPLPQPPRTTDASGQPMPSGDTDINAVVGEVRQAMAKVKTWRFSVDTTVQMPGQAATTVASKGQVDQSNPAEVKTYIVSEGEYGKSEVIGIGSTYYARTNDTNWVIMPEAPPTKSNEVLTDLPPGPVNSIGESTINGTKVNGYRIEGGQQVVEIFIDAKKRLVRSTAKVTGNDGTATQGTVDYSDYDAPANIVAPI